MTQKTKWIICRKDFNIFRDRIVFLPTIILTIDDPIHMERSRQISIHFLVFNWRVLWIECHEWGKYDDNLREDLERYLEENLKEGE